MQQCGIYFLKNVHNGKCYVGQSVDIAERRYSHRHKLRLGVHWNTYLQSDFVRYGDDGFEFVVLEEVGVDMLDVREIAWINYYKSNLREFGYNISGGGNSVHFHSPETRAKIAAGNRGKKLTERHKEQLRAARTGTKMSEATRAKMSASGKGRKFTEEHKRKIGLARLGKKYPRGVK